MYNFIDNKHYYNDNQVFLKSRCDVFNSYNVKDNINMHVLYNMFVCLPASNIV